ncbi:AAA family ATPase [Humibacter ginsengisoli]
MSRYLLITRSAAYEARLRRLFRRRVQAIPGEHLAFGADEIVRSVEGAPRIALLGPLLSYEETRALADAVSRRYPGIGLVVVREQRADLEDWVDGISMHAVLGPEASDQAVVDLLDRLRSWLVATGRLHAEEEESEDDAEDDDQQPDAIAFLTTSFDELISGKPPDKSEVAETTGDPVESGTEADDEMLEPVDEWVLPPIVEGTRTEVIVVAAPKGGQGKTTTAVNLAVALAEVEPNSVVLVDADMQFGDVASVLDLEPHRTIVELALEIDEVALKTLLTRHDSAFFVVAGPHSPELADKVAADSLGRLIDRLAGLFRYVIVDTTPGLDDNTLTAIEHATDAVFVSTLTVPALRALRTEFEILAEAELIPPNRHVVLNMVEKNTGLIVKDAERIIGAPVDVQVPRSATVLMAANAGEPVLRRQPRDPASRAMRQLACRLDGRGMRRAARRKDGE